MNHLPTTVDCPICGKQPALKGSERHMYYVCCGIDTDPWRDAEKAAKSWNKLVDEFVAFRDHLATTEKALQVMDHQGARVSIDMNAFQQFADSLKGLPPNTFGPAW